MNHFMTKYKSQSKYKNSSEVPLFKRLWCLGGGSSRDVCTVYTYYYYHYCIVTVDPLDPVGVDFRFHNSDVL